MKLKERIFQSEDLPLLPPPGSGAGVFALLSDGCALLDPTGPGAGEEPGPVHLPISSRGQLAALRDTPGVDAIALDGPHAPSALALAFAAHLRAIRPPWLVDSGPFVTAPRPGQSRVVEGLVPVLHFVTLHTDGGLVDTPVWEWITPSGAVTWFGGPLPDIGDLHARLDGLVALRRAARRGQLPATPDGDDLGGLLGGRYFSGRFVLEHHQLVRRLLTVSPSVLETP